MSESAPSKTKAWLHAARLRTLPLAVSGTLVGSAMARQYDRFEWPVMWLSISTSVFLQILSNFANDYGDFVKGTDNEKRVGTPRAMQSGMIGKKEMIAGMIICSILTLASGIGLLLSAFTPEMLKHILVFLGIGLLAMIAAIKYTVGKTAYGYKGLGDLFVFIFFGIVSVFGTFYLHTHTLYIPALLPAVSVGLFSTAVLNINNIRDIQTDKAAVKITIPVRLGEHNAKIYHLILMGVGFFSTVIFGFLTFTEWYQNIYLISMPVLTFNAVSVAKLPSGPEFNGFLKKMALSTLLFAVLVSAGCILG